MAVLEEHCACQADSIAWADVQLDQLNELMYANMKLEQQLEDAHREKKQLSMDLATAQAISASLQKLLNIERTKHGMISLCNGSSSSSSSSSHSRSSYSSSSSSWW